MKVLVYWPQERQWSIVSESAVQEDVLPGQRTNAKFQGKLYPSLIIASKCFDLFEWIQFQNSQTEILCEKWRHEAA